MGIGQFLIGLPAFLFVVTIVVFFHELGHFFVARLFGVTVEAFSLGFGKEVIGFTDRKGTRWKLSWLPFGGYVKFLGDQDASSKPDTEALKNLPASARANALHLKPLWQRALVVAAGPLANFVLAIAIFTGVAMTQDRPVDPPTVQSVVVGSAAEAAGFKAGDVIRTVNGDHIDEFLSFQDMVMSSPGKAFHVVVNRGGQQVALDVTARAEQLKQIDGSSQTVGRIGLEAKIGPIGFGRAVKLAVYQTWDVVSGTLSYVGQMISGHQSSRELRGPIGIATLSGQVAQFGIMALLGLTALISISIGLLNLFPIPVLDGGHLLYYGCEAVLGRPLGEKAQEVGFRVGLALVLGLMLLATFNDLVRFNLF